MPNLRVHGFGEKYRSGGMVDNSDVTYIANPQAFEDMKTYESKTSFVLRTNEKVFRSCADYKGNYYVTLGIDNGVGYLRKIDDSGATMWEITITSNKGGATLGVVYDPYDNEVVYYDGLNTRVVDAETADFKRELINIGLDTRYVRVTRNLYWVSDFNAYDKQTGAVVVINPMAVNHKEMIIAKDGKVYSVDGSLIYNFKVDLDAIQTGIVANYIAQPDNTFFGVATTTGNMKGAVLVDPIKNKTHFFRYSDTSVMRNLAHYTSSVMDVGFGYAVFPSSLGRFRLHARNQELAILNVNNQLGADVINNDTVTRIQFSFNEKSLWHFAWASTSNIFEATKFNIGKTDGYKLK